VAIEASQTKLSKKAKAAALEKNLNAFVTNCLMRMAIRDTKEEDLRGLLKRILSLFPRKQEVHFDEEARWITVTGSKPKEAVFMRTKRVAEDVGIWMGVLSIGHTTVSFMPIPIYGGGSSSIL
jgi:hypothetical protein